MTGTPPRSGPSAPSSSVPHLQKPSLQPNESLPIRLEVAAEKGLAVNVRRWLRLIGHVDGQYIEMQALDVPDGKWCRNHFAHAATASQIAKLLTDADRWLAPGVFFVANRIDPVVVTRSKAGEWHVARKGVSTTSDNITLRIVLYLDFDANRPKGTSSTSDQVVAALAVAEAVYARLAAILGGERALAIGRSGNGGAVLVALAELPSTKALTAKVNGTLAAIKAVFETASVTVDTSVGDPKRLCPAWGTIKRKGAPNIPERPHRRSALLLGAADGEAVERVGMDSLDQILEALMSDLMPVQRAAVNKVMGVRPSSTATAAAGCGGPSGAVDTDSPFVRAKDIDVRELAIKLELLDGEVLTCPGCKESSRPGGRVVLLDHGLKCSGARCAEKGRNGFRTPVDLVAEVRNCPAIEAARWIEQEFDLAPPPNGPAKQAHEKTKTGATAPVQAAATSGVAGEKAVVDYGGAARGRLDAISPDARYAIVADQVAKLQPKKEVAKLDRANRTDGEGATRPTFDEDGNLVYDYTPLANFAAIVNENIALDDGVDVSRALTVVGSLSGGGLLPQVRVETSEFERMAWPLEKWGARVAIRAGRSVRDCVREAIQVLSDPIERTVFRHSGWREINGQRLYLHAGGAIGVDGPATGLTVELDGNLSRLLLPSSIQDVAAAVRASLAFLEVAPLWVTAPLLSAAYRAPLSPFIPSNFATALIGLSGVRKSSIAALVQQHFGVKFGSPTGDIPVLPIDWLATSGAIENALFYGKDALVTIDDYKRAPDPNAQHKLEEKARHVYQSIGNRTARSRTTWGGHRNIVTLADHAPRAVALTTGEEVPPGVSTVGRMVIIDLRKEEVRIDVLTRVQASSPRFQHAMGGFIQWVAQSWDELAATLPGRCAEIAVAFRTDLAKRIADGEDFHARLAGQLAQIFVGVEVLIHFAREVGAIDANRAAAINTGAWTALLTLADKQREPQQENSPADRFVAALAALVASERVVLRHKTRDRSRLEDNRELLGWRDEAFAYVLPDVAMAVVTKHYRDRADTFSTGSKALLYRQLAQKNYIIGKREGKELRYERRETCGGARHRVLVMPLALVCALAEEDDAPLADRALGSPLVALPR